MIFINCSQTKFVPIILNLSVFFNAIFRLTDFSFDTFDFSYSKTGKTGSAQWALSVLRAFQLCFRDLYLCCEGRFLEVEDTPNFAPPPPPPPRNALLPPPLLPPQQPPPSKKFCLPFNSFQLFNITKFSIF